MFNNFPYTNFHNLNLDWIVKTLKLLFSKSVFSVNNVEPDAEGNVTITGAQLGAVGTINNISPDSEGNVTLTASDVGAIATGQGVTKVNGISPDASGNVLAGTVRSVNGISPASLPTPGSISLTASDVGALPSTIDPVETVNGISPDSNGNVNVGTVKSVNGSTPDANGNVNLPTVAGVTSVDGVGPDANGNVQLGNVYVKTVNGISPVNGNVNVGTVTSVNGVSPTNGNVQVVGYNEVVFRDTGLTAETGVTNSYTRIVTRPSIGICTVITRFQLDEAKAIYSTLISGFDAPDFGLPCWFLVREFGTHNCYLMTISSTGVLTCGEAMPIGTYEGMAVYCYNGNREIPINSAT